MTASPSPTSYRIIGPPDLLHDLLLDFRDIGWEVTVVRWQAVFAAPAEEAGHAPPAWPAEVTLAGVSHDVHDAACREYFTGVGDV